jgi:apolipoprotein D and lipocalin family protein
MGEGSFWIPSDLLVCAPILKQKLKGVQFMKTVFILLSLLILSVPALALETVASVDVSRYAGRWYQISRNPLPFEPLDCACAQQTLTGRPDGLVGVYNSCNRGGSSGPLIEIRGTASSNDPVTNAQFTVDFGLPQKGQYWIIGLDSDYRWAVVSDPSLRSLYILSKTPTLEPAQYELALAEAAKQAPLDKLVTTVHDEACSYPAMK